jgi:transcriptional regulator with XRE-family HTH domain
MKPKDRFSRLLKKHKDSPTYKAEGLLIDVAEQVVRLLHRRGLTQSELARKLGCSDAYVSKLLSGVENMTLRTLSDIGTVLKSNVDFAFVPCDLEMRRSFIFEQRKREPIDFLDSITVEESNEPHLTVAA